MKAVILSVRPQWVEKIVSGEKTIEVRKSRPKIDTPFKCYIYMTQGKLKELGTYSDWIYKRRMSIIGEFVCDRIDTIEYKNGYSLKNMLLEKSSLTSYELLCYGNKKDLYGWHISDLKIYDKPRELGEFKHKCNGNCLVGKKACIKVKEKREDIWANCDCLLPLTRAPQSWCYVEEI